MSEELKTLVQIMQSLSGDALSFAKWWLAYRVFSDVTSTGVLLYLIYRVFRLLGRWINNGHISKEIARHIGVDDRFESERERVKV